MHATEQQTQSFSQQRHQDRYQVGLARTAGEVDEVQRLRYQVFFEELGASAATRIMQTERDCDQYDASCEHLLVRDTSSDQVVGCYRIMRPDAARRRGGFYADSEFDLSRLVNILPRTAEVGRACIHPDFRSGSVILLLWSGLARFMVEHGYEYVIGCASIPLTDGRENAIAVYDTVSRTHLAPPEYRVFPRKPYPLPLREEETNASKVIVAKPRIPALIKGYTRLGAWIGGAPAWDPDFNTADLFVLLPISRMNSNYARHLIGHEQAA